MFILSLLSCFTGETPVLRQGMLEGVDFDLVVGADEGLALDLRAAADWELVGLQLRFCGRLIVRHRKSGSIANVVGRL